MITTKNLNTFKLNHIVIAFGAAGLLSASGFALAQTNKANDQAAKNIATKNRAVEEVMVTGVRGSLEAALNTKRFAPSIVDAISASDIDALPALGLGEALQALPGVQLNSGDEGRQSTISLRGLSSGFVKTTAFGQSFATPSAASNPAQVGASNPFAAFEAGIFDGVTVIKSPTADLQEGGMAGTVDKKLQRALFKKDGLASVSIGGIYEELADSYSPEIKLSAVKHLIDDTLAVAFKYSTSKQEFRRDTFDIVDYVSVETDENGARATNIDEYRAAWNVPDNADLRVPLRGRNVHQYSDGDRQSFSGNIEFRATDDLILGAHILSSERKLDNGTKEATSFETGLNRTNSRNDYLDGEVTLDLATAPFAYTSLTEDGSGGDAYIVSNIDFQNGRYQIENRKTTFNEKSDGIFLYGEYEKDDWKLDSKIALSKAQNNFENVGLNFVHEGNRTGAQTGFNGTINTGQGNLANIVVSGGLTTPYVYDDLTTWSTPDVTSSSVLARDPANQDRRLRAGVNGRVRDVTTDYNSMEFNAKRRLDLHFGEGLAFDAVKFGARFSKEGLESVDQRQSFAGIDTTNIGSDYLSTDSVLSAQQTSFFNGKIPGTFNHTNGWVTFDNDAAIKQLQSNIVTDRNDLVLPTHNTNASRRIDAVYPELSRNRSGFWDSMSAATDLPQNLDFNFEADQDLHAFYVTTDFSGELPLDMRYTGNIGVRYVETNNTFDGLQIGRIENDGTQDGTPIAIPTTFDDSYSNTLPMANIAFELTEDLILRAAGYKGIVRPNLIAQRPNAGVRENNSTVTLNLPAATVRPYEADNYDLSLEWYNRSGSAMSIGFFQKNITNLFESLDGYCPDDGSDAIVNRLAGDIERVFTSETEFTCQQTDLFQVYDDSGNLTEELNREVVINTTINNDNELKVSGYELAIQQKLDFLPYPWSGFGGVFNYTELKQSGSEQELTRVSPKSYNVITYWEDGPVSLRLAYNWRDDQILQGANSFLGTGVRTREAQGRLDFSGSYQFSKNLKLFVQAFNLTDEVHKDYYGYDERAIHSLSYQGRVYKASINYRF